MRSGIAEVEHLILLKDSRLVAILIFYLSKNIQLEVICLLNFDLMHFF